MCVQQACCAMAGAIQRRILRHHCLADDMHLKVHADLTRWTAARQPFWPGMQSLLLHQITCAHVCDECIKGRRVHLHAHYVASLSSSSQKVVCGQTEEQVHQGYVQGESTSAYQQRLQSRQGLMGKHFCIPAKIANKGSHIVLPMCLDVS